MRRADKETLAVTEQADALKCCCAACHAKAGESCIGLNGEPRWPHRVRIKVGRWAAKR